MEFIYAGKRIEDGPNQAVVFPDNGMDLPDLGSWGLFQTLDLRNDLHNHSPDGAEWGYLGSGPAQLALGILCHYFREMGVPGPDEKALAKYQEFKAKVVAGFQDDHWTLTTREISQALANS